MQVQIAFNNDSVTDMPRYLISCTGGGAVTFLGTASNVYYVCYDREKFREVNDMLLILKVM